MPKAEFEFTEIPARYLPAHQNEETVDLSKAASMTLQQQANALSDAVAVFKL